MGERKIVPREQLRKTSATVSLRTWDQKDSPVSPPMRRSSGRRLKKHRPKKKGWQFLEPKETISRVFGVKVKP